MNCENCKVYKLHLKTCARCLDVNYCSKDCQRQHWKRHKHVCDSKTQRHRFGKHDADRTRQTARSVESKIKDIAEDETMNCNTESTRQTVRSLQMNVTVNKQHNVLSSRYVLDEEEKLKRVEKQNGESLEIEKEEDKYYNKLGLVVRRALDERCRQKLSPEKANASAIRPPGSLNSAKVVASKIYPDAVIIDDLDDIPHEHLKNMLSHRVTNILVAFIFKYHGHVMRHGVYLQDKDDAVTRVEFYLDHVNDDPRPHFTYDAVKPGNFICLKNPYIHNFGDGTVGIRMDDPFEVKVIQV